MQPFLSVGFLWRVHPVRTIKIAVGCSHFVVWGALPGAAISEYWGAGGWSHFEVWGALAGVREKKTLKKLLRIQIVV
jgi:hypothetical protein